MSLFDFLFPEQAQASHLRGLLKHQQIETVREERREQVRGKLGEAAESVERLENQVARLEGKLNESEMIIRALAEMIFESSDYVAEDLKNLIEDIDARDGVVDGRITPDSQRPKPKFVAKRSWRDQQA